MTEISVALTDYLLAAECGLFAWIIGKEGEGNHRPRAGWVGFFAALGASSLLGGSVHGFFPGTASMPGALLWKGTMLTLGLATMACWMLGARMWSERSLPRWIRGAMVVQFLISASLPLLVFQPFWMAILNYLPAVVFLLLGSWVFHRRHRIPGLPLISLGLGLTLVASGMQQLRLGIHPRYFDHNALYHLMVGVGLGMVFLGVRRQPPGSPGTEEAC